MDGLLDQDDVILDLSILDETPLIFRNDPGKNIFILFAMNLVIILYPVLQREIGRNLEKLWAPFSLGINARKEELVLPPILLQF